MSNEVERLKREVAALQQALREARKWSFETGTTSQLSDDLVASIWPVSGDGIDLRSEMHETVIEIESGEVAALVAYLSEYLRIRQREAGDA